MSSKNLKLDDLISIVNKPNTTSPLTIDPNIIPLQGVVAYLGPVSFADGEDWVGVRLTGDSRGQGKNDGTVQGRRYFKRCRLNGGMFVRAGRVRARTTKKESKKESNRKGIGLRASKNHRSKQFSAQKRILSLEEQPSSSTAALAQPDESNAVHSKQSTHIRSEVVTLRHNVEELVGETEGLKASLNTIAWDKENLEKRLKEVETDQESANIKVGGLKKMELVRVREKSMTMAEVHAEVEGSCGDDCDDVSSTVSIAITTVDKEEESESNAANNVSNSNINASNETNSEEPGKDATKNTTEPTEEKRLSVLKIAETATFEEMNDGYRHTTKWVWKQDRFGSWTYELGYEKTVYVDMNQPRSCSYQKLNDTTKEYESVVIDSSSSSKDAEPGVELRGITLRQLRAIMANIDRRCLTEKWVDFDGVELDPKKVTLYDADHYVIRPYTVHQGESLVASLPSTAGPQRPRFFVSHWWGESVYDFINCIEQFVRDFASNKSDDDDRRGGGMTADTPIWVCAYGNNQWDLSDITVDPRESGFTKAMKEAEGRTITILDNEGVVFTRIWCVYELYLTLTNSQEGIKDNSEKGLWAIYTAKNHSYKYGPTKQERESVGIISGGSTSDQNWAPRTAAREEHFPYEVISKALTVCVENAEASVNDDRIHILNSIIGKSTADIDTPPPKEHAKYTELNEALKSVFAASQASLQGAAKEGDEKWMAMLVALSKGTKKDSMRFGFQDTGEFNAGFRGLTATRAIQLISHLPLTIKTLYISSAKFGSEFMEALIQRVDQFKNLEFLNIVNTYVGGEKGGQEAGVRLAKVLATNTTIKTLQLQNTDLIGLDNVVEWGDALMENKTLTRLRLLRVDGETKESLRTKTKERTTNLKIN